MRRAHDCIALAVATQVYAPGDVATRVRQAVDNAIFRTETSLHDTVSDIVVSLNYKEAHDDSI